MNTILTTTTPGTQTTIIGTTTTTIPGIITIPGITTQTIMNKHPPGIMQMETIMMEIIMETTLMETSTMGTHHIIAPGITVIPDTSHN